METEAPKVSKALKIFYCYARKDKPLCEEKEAAEVELVCSLLLPPESKGRKNDRAAR